MECWFIIIIIILVTLLLLPLPILLKSLVTPSNKKLPPGPLSFRLIGSPVLLGKSIPNVESLLRGPLRQTYGHVVTLRIGPRPHVFIGSHSSAHRALFQSGAAFSGRPARPFAARLHTINSSTYGATWRLLRRNLTSGILHPSRLESYSHDRAWVFRVLIGRLSRAAQESDGFEVMDHFRYSMFCLLALMCFGDKRDEDEIRQIETVQREILLKFAGFKILDILPPWISRILFRRRLKELTRLRRNQVEVLVPIIRSRIETVKQHREQHKPQQVAYVDTLVDLELPDGKRKLEEGDMVPLCGEFLNAGTDTTTTALQWIMANIVKYPEVQSKLYQEIVGVVGLKPEQDEQFPALVIKEEDLPKMPYLKAVVLEGLRRHPISRFVLPHSVTQDVELDGYLVPKDTTVNFLVAAIGWDPEIWDHPMEFRPERFLNGDGVFDITGGKEIKMMPFGAGRRVCPAANLALLHLEFFVANLVWYFEWKAVDGVDLSEKWEFTIVMKHPLKVNLYPRQDQIFSRN